MALVLKVDCRACNRACGEFKHLLEETIVGDEVKTFAALLNYCTTLDAFCENHESGMPQNICNSCVEHLFQSYTFKKMVLQNETAYRERLQAQGKSNKDEMVLLVNEEQVVKEEIDIEETMETEEFLSENEEVVAGNNVKTEYNGQEWVQIDKNYQSSVCVSNNKRSERQKNEFMENVSIDNVGNSNDIFVINEADAENYEYVNASDGKKYDSWDNDDKDDDIIFVEEQREENSNENKDKAKRKYTKRNNLSKADLICLYCGKVFNEKKLLKDHSCLYTGEKLEESGTKTDYNAHMLTNKDKRNSKSYACELCHKKFYTAEQLKLHSTIHNGARPFICGTCGKSYRKSSYLKAHIITHDNTQMSGHKQHMLFLNTNEHPYKCDLCGRPFLTYKSFANHKHTNSDFPSYPCTECGRTFRFTSSLKRHMVLHERQ